MDNKEFLPAVLLSDLRTDEEKISDTEGFWKNVPEYEDGYILTSRVKGV